MGGGGGLLGGITGAIFGDPPAPPPAPDYVGAAQTTAQGNLQAAQAATAANRVSQYTPYGSLVYSQNGVDSQGNPMWNATTNLNSTGQQLLNTQNQTSLGLGQTINSQLGNVQNTMGQGFNPYFDPQAYLRDNPDVAAAGVDPYAHYQEYGVKEGRKGGIGQVTSNVGNANLNLLSGNANLSQVGQGPQFSQIGQAQQAQGAGQAQQAYGVGSGEQAQRMGQAQNLQTGVAGTGMQGWDQATQLLMSRLSPQMAQDSQAQAAQLANQGIVAGTKAYDNAMRSFNQGQNDLRTQAQLQGAQVQNQMFNQNLQAGQFGNQAITQQNQNQLANTGLNNSAIAQNFGQNLSAQQLQNQAAQQNYSNQLAGTQLQNQAGQQNFTNQLAGLGFNNQQSQQGYQNQLAQQQANNAAMQQMYQNSQTQQQGNNAIGQQQFGNQMANANLANQAQQQAYTQALTNYNMPLNTLSALRSGAQVQNPTFQNVPQQATTSGADILGATTAAGNYNLGTYNAQQAAQAGMNSGLLGLGGSLGGAAIMGSMMSDIRTKENIVKIGIAENGLPVYIYEYKPEWKEEAGHGKFVGYMAHEVETVHPEAVITRPDGYKMVDYGVLNA